jgi:hypothetical protein
MQAPTTPSAAAQDLMSQYSSLLDEFANSSVRRRRRVRDGGKRNKLSFNVVQAIFERRPQRSEVDGTFVPCAELVRQLSQEYKVQARTIRDIWNRRSWGFVTRPLWTLAEIAGDQGIQNRLQFGTHHIDPVQMRKRGRPHGAKDTVKRRRKTESECMAGSHVKQEASENVSVQHKGGEPDDSSEDIDHSDHIEAKADFESASYAKWQAFPDTTSSEPHYYLWEELSLEMHPWLWRHWNSRADWFQSHVSSEK